MPCTKGEMVNLLAGDESESVKNTNERNQVGANAMRIFHGLFVRLGAWRFL